ncbi:MAG TPA: hypothetical protein PLV32_14410, partial [Chitinophagaceae bacterium]|nr:hypothetical protein [Chitinophagaceae bacterium]
SSPVPQQSGLELLPSVSVHPVTKAPSDFHEPYNGLVAGFVAGLFLPQAMTTPPIKVTASKNLNVFKKLLLLLNDV